LKIQTLKVPPAKSSSVQSKNSPSTQIPATLSGKAAVQPIVAKHAVAKDERRRSQRVLLRIRASIHVALQGQAETFDVATLSVNPHGAVVVMKQSLPLETRLVLEHNGTKERVGCKVVRPPREMPEGFHVPIEFDAPAPDFWRIDFPPADWRPENL
jgi:hypothetical protein